MKKLFALLAVAAFFFAACGNKTTAPEQEAAQGTETEQVIEQEPVADIAAPVEGEENAETPAEEAPVEGEVQA